MCIRDSLKLVQFRLRRKFNRNGGENQVERMLKYWCIVGAKYKNQKEQKAAEIPSFLPSLAELECMPLKVPEKLTSRTMPSKCSKAGSKKRSAEG